MMEQKQKIDELVKNYRPASAKSKEEAWKELSARLQKEKPATKNLRWITIAAAFLAAALVFTVLADSFLFTKNYATSFGEQQTVVLPDESEVILNPNSILKVNYSSLTGRRKLSLSGQALFDVEEGKTFSVRFDNAKVTVLGTRFIIKSYEGVQPEVKCLSGSVEVITGTEKVVVTQGEGVIINEHSEIISQSIDEKEVLDEMEGKYYLHNEPMEQIFLLLEARLGYRVEAPQSLLTRKFTGEIDFNRPGSVCDILSFAMDVNCTINHQQKTITFEYRN